MAIAVLIEATIVDLAIGALMIGVSGFIFEKGPEGGHAGNLALAFYVAAIIACAALALTGFILNRRDKTGLGIALAFLPPLGALIVMMIPASY